MATPPSRSKIWSRPWGYPEALIILAGILLVGYLWQYIMGPIPAGFFTAPLSIIISVALVVAALYIGLRGSRLYAGRRTPTIVLFVLSPAATLTALGGCLVLLLIMGFCVQAPPDGNGRALRLLAPQWLELDGTLLPLQPALPLPPPHLRLYLGTSPDTYALALAGYRLCAQPRGTLLLPFLCPAKRRLHAALPHGT